MLLGISIPCTLADKEARETGDRTLLSHACPCSDILTVDGMQAETCKRSSSLQAKHTHQEGYQKMTPVYTEHNVAAVLAGTTKNTLNTHTHLSATVSTTHGPYCLTPTHQYPLYTTCIKPPLKSDYTQLCFFACQPMLSCWTKRTVLA